MKASLLTLLASAGVAFAGFETWTNSEGQEAKLDLVKVEDVAGEKVGTFRMVGGRTVTLKASQLAEADAARLAEWKAGADEDAAATGGGPGSVYDELFDGNLLVLDGKSLKRAKDLAKPAKYYVFYRTASWCGPCQKFTPSLVDFYNENKNDDFEVVVITSDSSEDAMEEYARDKKMPWPHLKLRKVEDFKEEFPDKGTGIPYMVVANLEGEIVAEANAYSLLPRLKQLLSE